ncbi:hypothetical protein BJV82DRAFT_619879 [Fennellomyces sp. T-0311]|nr:hypothetical protein BJV82DRAFT_619879 [Fennellomyces sp. T-0311]
MPARSRAPETNGRAKPRQHGRPQHSVIRRRIRKESAQGLVGLRIMIALVGIALAFLVYWYPEEQLLGMADAMRARLTGK